MFGNVEEGCLVMLREFVEGDCLVLWTEVVCLCGRRLCGSVG